MKKKYFYASYQYEKGHGYMTFEIEGKKPVFDYIKAMRQIKRKVAESINPIIMFWTEITKEQFESK